jgi:putative membrane protein insertion efficiency factor
MKIGWTAAISLFVVISLPAHSFASEWGPWSSNTKAPVLKDESSQKIQRESHSDDPATAFLVGGVRFFQKYISPVDGPRCSMTPTCSHYSLQAIRKHGPFLGFMMTADRIVHEYEEQKYVPTVWDGSRSWFYDPVENNDFWFDSPRTSGKADAQSGQDKKMGQRSEIKSSQSLRTGE